MSDRTLDKFQSPRNRVFTIFPGNSGSSTEKNPVSHVWGICAIAHLTKHEKPGFLSKSLSSHHSCHRNPVSLGAIFLTRHNPNPGEGNIKKDIIVLVLSRKKSSVIRDYGNLRLGYA
jgi:hypothetical protein